MLGNLFKPKWQHTDAKVRIQALDSLAGDSVEIIKLAQTDPHSAVRMEAVVRLTHIPTLVKIGHTPGSIGERARQRIVALAASDHHHDHLLADVFQWLQQNPALLRSLARDPMRGVKLRHQAINLLDDQELLFNIASNDTSKEIQFLAASHICDLDKLKVLEKTHGKNNKRLRQLLKERMEQEQQRQQEQERIESLCAEAEALGKASTFEQDKTRARILQQSWSPLANKTSTEQQQRFSTALENFQQRLNTHEAEQAELKRQQAEQKAEQARLRAEAQQRAEQEAQAEREKQEQTQQQQAEERRRIKQQQTQREEALKNLHNDLKTLETHLENEQYGEAIDLHSAFLQRLKETPDIPGKDKSFFQRRIQMFTPYIRELQDWRRWGTDQVRKQLIETAENLRTEDELDPVERAKQVQSLRDEWRKLARMEPGQQRTLWKEFDATATAAYEPSKQHFNEQAHQRETNLTARNEICAQLEIMEAAIDWENTDWRNQQTEVNKLRKQWKNAGTVNHKDWKLVNQRFNNAMDALEKHFKTERDRNWQDREQLVQEAQSLLELADTQQAIDQAKELQARWQISLASRPSDEQRLWKQFREPIDSLFSRSREERQQKRAEYDARQAEATRLEEEKLQRELERQQQQQAELETMAEQSVVNKQAEAPPETLAANQTSGEKLCMQMEILLELDTPTEFQKARMEYQISNLSEAMLSRKETSSPTSQALKLLKEWYALEGMSAEAFANQNTRIEKIRAAL